MSAAMVEKSGMVFDPGDIVKLTREYETPFYLISEKRLMDNFSGFVRAFKVAKFKLYYSLKSNFESMVVRTLKELGAGAEVCSDLDMLIAERTGFNPEDIVFDGPGKSESAVEKAIIRGFHIINVESLRELQLVEKTAAKHNQSVKVGFRFDFRLKHYDLNRFFELRHKKFGFTEDDIDTIKKQIKACRHIRAEGLFTHLNTVIAHADDYRKVLKKLFFFASVFRGSGIDIQELNIGGGYPVGDFEKFARLISRCYAQEAEKYGFLPMLAVEPGKALVDDAAIIVGKVIDVFRGWAMTDISINDLDSSRPLSKRPFLVANKAALKSKRRINIGGSTLRPNDVLYRDVLAAPIAIGDIIMILNVGAYSIPMATQFTRPRSAVYFKDRLDRIVLIRQKESPEEVLRSQKW